MQYVYFRPFNFIFSDWVHFQTRPAIYSKQLNCRTIHSMDGVQWWSQVFESRGGGTAAAAPPPFRPGNPALCGSCPLVTPYYCRLEDLLCYNCMLYLSYHFVCMHVYFVFSLFSGLFSFVDLPSVLWYCWLGLLTCKNHLPYNLPVYCFGGDVKHCTIQSNSCKVKCWGRTKRTTDKHVCRIFLCYWIKYTQSSVTHWNNTAASDCMRHVQPSVSFLLNQGSVWFL